MTTHCDPGHYCPDGTSFPNQFPCPLGSYTDAINLTIAAECTPCPERFACSQTIGTQSNTIETCAPGHYCPPSTPSPTSFDCPPGTYSNRTDLKEVRRDKTRNSTKRNTKIVIKILTPPHPRRPQSVLRAPRPSIALEALLQYLVIVPLGITALRELPLPLLTLAQRELTLPPLTTTT